MKKLHLGFGIAAVCVFAAGLIHGGIAWIVAEMTWDPYLTSFPTWAAFVLPLPFYALGVAAVLLAWLAAWGITKGVKKNRCKKQDGVLS